MQVFNTLEALQNKRTKFHSKCLIQRSCDMNFNTHFNQTKQREEFIVFQINLNCLFSYFMISFSVYAACFLIIVT